MIIIESTSSYEYNGYIIQWSERDGIYYIIDNNHKAIGSAPNTREAQEIIDSLDSPRSSLGLNYIEPEEVPKEDNIDDSESYKPDYLMRLFYNKYKRKLDLYPGLDHGIVIGTKKRWKPIINDFEDKYNCKVIVRKNNGYSSDERYWYVDRIESL